MHNHPEETQRNAVCIGGDSDTIGAMAGSIAEAYYGVPIELEEKALSYLPNDLQGLCHAFRVMKKKGLLKMSMILKNSANLVVCAIMFLQN